MLCIYKLPLRLCVQGSSSGPDGAAALSIDALADLVIRWDPDTEGAGTSPCLTCSHHATILVLSTPFSGEDLPRVLAEALRPAALAAFQQQLQAVFTAAAEARRRRSQLARHALERAHQRLLLYLRGTAVADADEALHQTLTRHLVRSVGSEALTWLLRYLVRWVRL